MISERTLPYLLLAPCVVFLLAFFGWPFVQTFVVAFQDNGEWSLDNFATMASDINFAFALENTLWLLVAVVPIQVALSLAMAMMLSRMGGRRDLALYVWTIPLGISDLAAGIVWLSLVSERGYLNTFLNWLGVIEGPQLWLSYETPLAMFIAVVVAEIWRGTAIVLVILVAGVQLIPKEYNEAAEVFGARAWTRFRRVTLPLLKPSLQTALILRTILAIEVFAVVAVLGGSNMPVLMGEAYLWQHVYLDTGVATAYAILILALSIAATIVYLVALRTRDEARI